MVFFFEKFPPRIFETSFYFLVFYPFMYDLYKSSMQCSKAIVCIFSSTNENWFSICFTVYKTSSGHMWPKLQVVGSRWRKSWLEFLSVQRDGEEIKAISLPQIRGPVRYNGSSLFSHLISNIDTWGLFTLFKSERSWLAFVVNVMNIGIFCAIYWHFAWH